MKCALILFLLSLSAFGQDLAAKFKEAEVHAPKGYPTLFVVDQAVKRPAVMFGREEECGMTLETLGTRIYVSGAPGMLSGCKMFTPGTLVYGKVHRLLGQVVDILDTTGDKPKSHRYIVQNIELLDPAKQ